MFLLVRKILIALVFLGAVTLAYFSVDFGLDGDKAIVWGVNFSQKQVESLGLDWQEVYLAILEDLNVKEVKVAAHWDLLEPERDEFFYEDLDWQIEQAVENKARVLLVVGMKTPRWPECHIPEWAQGLKKEEQQEEILEMLGAVVSHYKNVDEVWAWQVENEVFFEFGVCPWQDVEFLKKEVELVKQLDSSRPVVVTDSGEWSFWGKAAHIGDIVGVTMYRKAWFSEYDRYTTYPHPAISYGRRAVLVKLLYGKDVLGVELQAEPWVPTSLVDASFEEQEKTMSLAKLKENINYARRSGLNTHYLWGAEYWWWLKQKHDRPELWNETKSLFNN